jgi:hypothetical protein
MLSDPPELSAGVLKNSMTTGATSNADKVGILTLH